MVLPANWLGLSCLGLPCGVTTVCLVCTHGGYADIPLAGPTVSSHHHIMSLALLRKILPRYMYNNFLHTCSRFIVLK